MTHIINYCLNKYLPYTVVFLLVFYNMNYATWHPYLTMAFVLFIDKFSFKTGYSVAYCESRGIDISKPPKD